MAKLNIEVNTDNDAFRGEAGHAEYARVLGIIEDAVTAGDRAGVVRDINGNTVGKWTATEPDAEPEALDGLTLGQAFWHVSHVAGLGIAAARHEHARRPTADLAGLIENHEEAARLIRAHVDSLGLTVSDPSP